MPRPDRVTTAADWRVRAALLVALTVPSLHCADGGEAGGCACSDRPGDDDSAPADDDVSGGDDDSGDDDSADDDDSTPFDPTAELPACEGGVLAAFSEAEIQPPGVASNGYQVPGADTLEGVASSMDALLLGDAALALANASVVGYELCRGEGAEAATALWRPVAVGTGRALAAWRAVGARGLVVEAPHPWFETGTLEQAVALFRDLPARALVVSGTHRCANPAPSPCDGTTSACGGSGVPFRESDIGHVDGSVFQTAHEVFAEAFPDDLVASLHGSSEAGISLSDGTLAEMAAESGFGRLADALLATFPGENVTACNPGTAAPVDERLCGETNVQGRQLNGSPDACLEAAAGSSGRFLHLEQSTAVRAQPELLVAAFDAAIPAP